MPAKTDASTITSNGATDTTAAAMFGAFTYDKPPRRSDAPPISPTKQRRIELAGGAWVDVRGGGKQQEGNYLIWLHEQLQQANRDFVTGKMSADQLHTVELSLNAGYATWLDARLVAHNLTDDDGAPLPEHGFDLFWELSANDAIQLCYRIQAKESMFADPKDKPSSTTG